MAAIRTVLPTPIAEGTTPILTATFRDNAGALIPDANILTASALIHDVASGEILRSVLNLLSPAKISSSVLTWRLDPTDTAIVSDDDDVREEKHICLIQWTWNAGASVTGYGKHEIEHTVRNFAEVP